MGGEYIPIEQPILSATTPAPGSVNLFAAAEDEMFRKKNSAGTVTFLPEGGAPDAPGSTSYTLAITDVVGVVMNNGSGNSVIIPQNDHVPFPVGIEIPVRQTGTGLTSIAGASSVTVHTAPSYASRGQWSKLILYQESVDVWIVNAIN